jgi:hypothetical protein
MKGLVYGPYTFGLLKHCNRQVETTSEYGCMTSISVSHLPVQYIELDLVHKTWFLSHLVTLHALPISPSLI